MSALLADLKDFLADVPNERGVGDGMKAWAKELLDRMNAASTQNIFDVAPQQEHPTKAVNHESGTGEVGLKTGDGCARKPLTNTNSDTQLISENSNTYGGVAVSPAAPKVLDVAGHEGMVGDEGVSGFTNTRARYSVPPCSISEHPVTPTADQERGISDSQYSTISQKQRIDAEMRLIFRSSISTTLDPADDPRFA